MSSASGHPKTKSSKAAPKRGAKSSAGSRTNGENVSRASKHKSAKPKPKGEKDEKASEGQKSKLQPRTTGNGVLHSVVSKNRVFHRSHSVDPSVLKELESRFPDWAFEFGTQRPHDHPVGATERAICEQLVYEDIHRKFGEVRITDIGGSTQRHLRAMRQDVHSCNPIISSSDVIRRIDNPPEGNFCNKSSLLCDVPADVYMSVHSLYYLSQGEVLELLRKSKMGRLFAVVHRFNDLYGGLHTYGNVTESKYETFVDGDRLLVRMNVSGNFVGYTHDPCHWLNSTCYREGRVGMSWTGRPVGDSWIIEFCLMHDCRGLLVDSHEPLALVSSLRRNDHYGNVSGVLRLGDETTFKPMLEMLQLKVNKVKSYGPFMWLGGKTNLNVLVPKSIVEQVAIKMIGLPRNKDSLKQCINYMKLAVAADKISIPASMRADCIIYGSSLAFVLFVREEIESFNRICSPYYQRLYNKLNSALSMGYWAPLFSCNCSGGRDDSQIITVQTYNATRASVPSRAFDAAKAWPAGLPGYESNRALATMRPGSQLKNASRERVEDKPAFYAVCTTFSNYIPIVPTPSINNETVSLANRALMDTPEPNQEVWDKLSAYAYKKVIRRFLAIDPTQPDEDFAEWNSKFPKARALNQAKAYESLKSVSLKSKDFTRKAFSKKELTMKGGANPEDFDPRAIQGNTDRFNAAYGPFTSKMSEQLKKLWHSGARITYTCGMTAEQIGTWRDQFGDEDVLILECDESRYDCHQRKQAQDLYEYLEKHGGSHSYPNVSDAIKGCREVFGYSSRGVKYKVSFTMTSGVPKTSTSNSFINGVKTTYIVTEICGYKCWMLVNGDDNLCVIRGQFSEVTVTEIIQAIKDVSLSLGFETKVKASTQWSQVEYCSSLFWPTNNGTVLGPKIGKRLPKIGFSLNPLKVQLVKGMLIGLQIECGFVPVLRTYARHQLGLVEAIKEKTFLDKDRRHKSLPTSSHEANSATFAFFMDRYGVDASVCEEALSACLTDNLTDCVDYNLLETFTNVDL